MGNKNSNQKNQEHISEMNRIKVSKLDIISKALVSVHGNERNETSEFNNKENLVHLWIVFNR